MAQKELPFNMQHQQQSNWCWSAVSTSVSLFYNSGSGWTQCTLANQALGQSSCCNNGGSSACNQAWYLDRALTITGNYVSSAASTEPMSVIQAQINAGKPLGCRIQWRPNGGHFVIINGYDTVANTVDVRDPWYGSTENLPYNTFATNYQNAGYWNWSYFTKS